VSYFVYLLLCKDKTIYTGITTDVQRRLSEHKAKTGAKYTRARGADVILYVETYKNRSTASRREAEIKKMRRAQKLKLSGR